MLLQDKNKFPRLEDIPGTIALDTETHPDMSLEGYSFAYVKNRKIKSFYVPVAHTDILGTGYVNVDKNYLYLKKLCKGRRIIFHNAQFDLTVLKNIGIDVKEYEDTMLMHYTLDTERRHGLKKIMENEYDKEVTLYDDAKEAGFVEFSKYADNDARFTLYLYNKLRKEFKKFPNSYNLYKNVELPFVKVLQFINYEDNYIRINKRLLKKYCNIVLEELSIVNNILLKKLGNINFNSSQQLGYKLESLGYNIEYTDAGNPSTGAKKLEYLKKTQGGLILDLLLYNRKINKMSSTYVHPMFDRLQKIDKDVYVITGYDLGHISSRGGRLAGHNPNLQNQPRDVILLRCIFLKQLYTKGILKTKKLFLDDDKMAKLLKKYSDNKKVQKIIKECSIDIRAMFIPMKGYVFIGADYSQIELRMAAHLSGDKNMCSAFKKGLDIHSDTAKAITELLHHRLELTRQGAKEFNFGLLYGLYYTSIAEKLGIPKKDAKEFYMAYFKRYYGIEQFIKDIHSAVRKSHYAQTILGRRRNIDKLGINDMGNFGRRNYAENASISHVVSGSCADLIKLAMLDLFKYKNKCKIKLQVHDELLFEVKKDYVDKYKTIVKNKMEKAMKLCVPVIADVKVGNSWREVH